MHLMEAAVSLSQFPFIRLLSLEAYIWIQTRSILISREVVLNFRRFLHDFTAVSSPRLRFLLI